MTDTSPAAAPSIIDADVHLPIPTTDDLRPYLPEHWSELVGWTKFRPRALNTLYPAWTGLGLDSSSAEGNAAYRVRLDNEVFDKAAFAVVQAYFGVESIQHPYFTPDLATAVNHWMATEWLDRDDRLRGSATVAPQFSHASAAEVHRIAQDPRFVQVLVQARSMEPYGHHRHWPLWEAVAETGLVAAITYGGAVPIAANAINWMDTFFAEYSAGTQTFQTHMTSLIFNGVFDRWPTLKFAFVDSGWTWVPALCWRLDKEWKENRQEVPWVKRPPSEYVKEHFRFTTAPADAPLDERHLRQIVRHLPYSDLLMYSSDFPRSEPSAIEQITASFSDAERDRVMSGNARELYGLTDTALAAVR